ncbi:MAG: hypothetical protein ACRD8O_10815 [Bryobacteraceae bacterium]
MRIKVVGVILCGVVAMYGMAIACAYVAMRQPPETFGAIMSNVPMPVMMAVPFRPLWMSARQGKLRVGDAAPDFSLPAPDGSRVVKLSDEFRERPVVLIFGSYT